MFEDQYNEEMVAEVTRLEAKKRAASAGHPEWLNACAGCGCELAALGGDSCVNCQAGISFSA